MAFDSENGHGRIGFELASVIGGNGSRSFLAQIQNRVGQTVSIAYGYKFCWVMVGPMA